MPLSATVAASLRSDSADTRPYSGCGVAIHNALRNEVKWWVKLVAPLAVAAVRLAAMSTATTPPANTAAKQSEVALKDRGNLFEIATKQIEKAMKLINIDQDVAQILGQPKNELIVNFPVRRDSGRFEMFKGYRVQHNNILGPYKGGMRYHHEANLDEMKALASWMTMR